jgi:DNA-binding Xre family transcriptional regulator
MIQCRFRALVVEKEQRDGQRWMQKDISAATGISMVALSKYARSTHQRFDGRTVVKLCNFFECGIGEFLVRDGGTASREATIPLDEPIDSDESSIHISVYCGYGEQGERRKWALEQLAAANGFIYHGRPSVGRMVVALANQYGAARGFAIGTGNATIVSDRRQWSPKIAIAGRFDELLARKRARDYQRRWTLNAVAEVTGLDRPRLAVFRQERINRFGAVALEVLCKFLDCEVSDLLYLACFRHLKRCRDT